MQTNAAATIPTPTATLDEQKLNELLGRTIVDFGGAHITQLVVIGDRLGLYRALNPVGRAYYAGSTLICTPCSLAQEVGLALGAQAGEARMRAVVTSGGFTRFRRTLQTPFNLIYEARP